MANDMFLNPAKTTFFSSDFKVGAAYRNQWQTVSVSGYNTYLLTAEAKLYQSRRYRQSLGIGIGFARDVAGSLQFGQRNIFASLAYNKQIKKSNNQFIGAGIQIGNINWSYDISNADFGQSESDKEGILLSRFSVFDLSAGLHWQMDVKEESNIAAGIAMFHMNEPALSFYDNSEVRLKKRFTSYLSWMMPTSENTRLKLLVLSSFQNDNYEITGGADMVYSLSRTMVDTEAVGLGLYFRSNDAIILSPYYQYNSFTAGLSYDINISGLSAATKTYGALELWLSYGFNISGYRKQIKSIPCPTF